MYSFLKAISLSVVFIAVLAVSSAQSVLDDEPNINDYLDKFSTGIATISMVGDLETRARNAFDNGNCEQAIPLLEEWSKQSNTLANLYRQTLRPFYRSTRSDREDEGFSIRSIEDFVDNEAKSNHLLLNRNIAWVYLGECYVKVGDEIKAISYFSQALDLISVGREELENWNRAAHGIMNIIGQ